MTPAPPGIFLCRNVTYRVLQRLAVAVDQHIPGPAVGHRQVGMLSILDAENIRLNIAGLPFCTHQMNMAALGTSHDHRIPAK
jgi:hypothetical protein